MNRIIFGQLIPAKKLGLQCRVVNQYWNGAELKQLTLRITKVSASREQRYICWYSRADFDCLWKYGISEQNWRAQLMLLAIDIQWLWLELGHPVTWFTNNIGINHMWSDTNSLIYAPCTSDVHFIEQCLYLMKKNVYILYN